MRLWLLILAAAGCSAATVPFDMSNVKQGPVRVASDGAIITVRWSDNANRPWTAEFSLDPEQPLIRSIAVNEARVMDRARPIYRCSTGKRRGGWDAFFDFPPSHPAGTRSFLSEFKLQSARARTVGD